MESSSEDHYTIPYTNNRFCGPAALAYIMQSDPDSAAKLLREVSGRRAIMRTAISHMISAIIRAGFRVSSAMPDWAEWRTLGQWYNLEVCPEDVYLVLITGHYIIVHRGKVFDSRFHLGRPVERCPYLRRHVKKAWRIYGAHAEDQMKAVVQ